ncbi:hypothetical protein HZR23_09085 [Serpentinicella alkaliphila]|nr:hypothetical protein [Serpentinicella alkaliphila]QUH25873.1 hypothetical protein HZR23_09085 [Serpentinicella alkaliphila]
MEYQQETKLEMILSQINVSKIASSMRKCFGTKGPKGNDPFSFIYALIAMQVEKYKLLNT